MRKLKGLTQDKWEKMVDLIDQYGNEVPLKDMTALMSLEKSQEVEALAARGNMTTIVKMLHDKSSQLMDMLIHSLSKEVVHHRFFQDPSGAILDSLWIDSAKNL